MVEQRGIEPLTSALRTRRSAKLSYCPTRNSILPFQVSAIKFQVRRNAVLRLPHVDKKSREQAWMTRAAKRMTRFRTASGLYSKRKTQARMPATRPADAYTQIMRTLYKFLLP